MSSLFLLDATWDKSPALVNAVRGEAAAEEATILALDFWAGRKLRESAIPYATPREYLHVRTPRDLDASAAELARTWYESLGNRLNHRGIPLGQMAELDFTFLFIDALRSIEIAERVLNEHAPDRIFLSPPKTVRRPNAICHESLPSIVAYLARGKGISATWAGSSHSAARPLGAPSYGRDRLYATGETARRAPNILLRGLELSRAYFSSLAHGRKGGILFMRLGSFSRVAAAMNGTGLRGQSLPATRSGWLRARLKAGSFRALWEELRVDASFREALTVSGIPLSEILENRFTEFFHHTVPDLIEYVEGTNWLIRILGPRMLVVPEDISPVMRTVSRVFREHGLPILVIQHGAVSVDIGGLCVMPLEADRSALWGEIVRDWHIKRGKPKGSQVVTGNPGFDPITGGFGSPKGEILRRLRLRPDVPMILVATEWFSGISVAATVEDEERFIRHTLRALRQFPDHQVVIKLHPNYQPEYRRLVQTIAAEEKVQVTIATDSLWDLLALSEVAIVSNSTVGIEAMILQTPVVMVHAYEGIEEIPYAVSGAALGASGPEEIAMAVSKALHDDQVREAMAGARDTFVRGYAHTQDGRASERVAELILTMTEYQRGAPPGTAGSPSEPGR